MLVIKNIEGIRGLAGVKQQIKTGDTVSVKVIKHLSGNSWQISLKGKLLPVLSEVPLQEENTVTAQAFWSGKTLRLRVLHGSTDARGALSKAISGLLTQAGIPIDGASQAVVEALQRSGMPLQPELISRLYKQLKQYGSEENHIARLLVLFADKGLENPSKFLDTVLPYFPQQDPEKREKERQRKREQEKKQDEGRYDTGETKKNRPVSEETIRETLKNSLFFPTGPKDTGILLFNHLRGAHDNWVIVPVSLCIEESTITGTIRIKTVEGESTPEIIMVTFLTDAGTWDFQFKKKDDGFECRIFSSPEALRNEGNKNLSGFSEKLRKLGVKIVDTIRECSVYDGFSSKTDVRYKNIDTIV
jgi:hypothetical protein